MVTPAEAKRQREEERKAEPPTPGEAVEATRRKREAARRPSKVEVGITPIATVPSVVAEPPPTPPPPPTPTEAIRERAIIPPAPPSPPPPTPTEAIRERAIIPPAPPPAPPPTPSEAVKARVPPPTRPPTTVPSAATKLGLVLPAGYVPASELETYEEKLASARILQRVTKGWVTVSPRFAQDNPEAVVKVGEHYYRPAVSAKQRRATKGMTREERYIHVLQKRIKAKEVKDYTTTLQTRYDQLHTDAEALSTERSAMLGYAPGRGFPSGWADRFGDLSPEDKRKYNAILKEEGSLRQEAGLLNTYLASTRRRKAGLPENQELFEAIDKARDYVTLGTGGRMSVDILGAIDAGVSTATLLALGISEKGIRSAKKFPTIRDAEGKRVFDLIKIYEDDKLRKAYEEAYPESAVAFKALEEFRTANIEIKDGVWVNRDEWQGLTLSQQEEVKATGQYTERELITSVVSAITREGVAKEVSPILTTVWRVLTPWEEGKGETFLDFVKETPQRFLSPDIPSQAELKAAYEAEQSAPLWSRLLFGSSVLYDKANDTYHPIVLAEYPTGKKGAAVAATRVLTKTIEINYNKLISPRVNKPQINWNKITEVIKAGAVRSAQDAARWAAARRRWVPPTRLTPGTPAYRALTKELTAQGLSNAAAAAARIRTLDALSKAKVVLVPGPGASVDWSPFKPSELTVTRMKELVTQWEGMKPSEAIKQISDANLVTAVAAYQPEFFGRILSQVTPAQRHRTISRLQPNAQEVAKAGNLTKLQELAKTQLKVSTQLALATALALETATQTAVETMTKALTEGKTMTQAQTEALVGVESAIQTKLQTLTETATQVETATQALTQIAIEVATRLLTKTTTVPITKIPSPKVPPAVPPPLPPPPILIGVRDGVTPRKRIKPGSITWYQGELAVGKGENRVLRPIWKVIAPPWQGVKPQTLFAPPIGAVRTGNKTAKGTIQMIGAPGAKVPESVSIDLGTFDIFISDFGRTIKYISGGEKTVVGKRDPSPTEGMSIPDVGFAEVPRSIVSVRKKRMAKPKKKKRLTAWEYATTLKGFRP